MEVNKILEKRLQLRESQVGGGTWMSRCANRLHVLQRNGDIQAANNFMRDVLMLQQDFFMSIQMHDACLRELDEYEALESDIESEIASTQDSILNLEKELAQEKQLRRHREECETLAQGVASIPSLPSQQKQIEEADARLAELEQQMLLMQSRIKARAHQVGLIFSFSCSTISS